MSQIPDAPQPAPPKKSSGCLKAFLISLGIVVFCMIVVGIMVYQSVRWFANAPEPTVASYAPLKLSEGEQEDLNRIITSLDQAKNKGTLVDESSITPDVFNGVVERILEGERMKHPEKKDIPVAIRGGFAGNQMQLRLTIPISPEEAQKQNLTGQHYVNAEAIFNIEIVEGEIKELTVDHIRLRGKDAPFFMRIAINHFINLAKQENQRLKNSPDNPLGGFKLLKREGDRLHVIIDGKKWQEFEARKQEAPKKPNSVQPEKKEGATTF